MANVLFLDGEMSYFLGAFFDRFQPVNHTNIFQDQFLISIQWAWEGGEVESITSVGKDDTRVVKKAHQLLEKADYVIMHNGDKHDWPIILERIISLGLPPINEPVFIDTLKMSKKIKAASRSLDFLTKKFQLPLKRQSEPGTWLAASLHGDRKAIKSIEEYGKGDIPTLQALYYKLAPYIKNKLNRGIGSDRPCCTNCASNDLSKAKSRRSAKFLKQQWQCNDCGKYMTTNVTEAKAFFS